MLNIEAGPPASDHRSAGPDEAGSQNDPQNDPPNPPDPPEPQNEQNPAKYYYQALQKAFEILASIEPALSQNESDQGYRQYLIDIGLLRLPPDPDADPEGSRSRDYYFRALQSAIRAVASIEPALRQNEQDEGYREYLVDMGLIKESIPEQYFNYLSVLRAALTELHETALDPWILRWLRRRFQDYESPINFEIPSSRPAKDPVSFGKLGSVVDFDSSDDLNRRVGQRMKPVCTKPVVAEILNGNALSHKSSDTIRWIHLPANNKAWVEVSTPTCTAHLEGGTKYCRCS